LTKVKWEYLKLEIEFGVSKKVKSKSMERFAAVPGKSDFLSSLLHKLYYFAPVA